MGREDHEEEFAKAVLSLLKEAFETLDDLKRDEREQYAEDVREALGRIADPGDLSPVVQVIESWQRTMLFDRQPGFEQKIATAKSAMDAEEPMSWEEITETLAV